MLIGYTRVSKADGSQSTDLQRDALLAAGVDSSKPYEDHASGKKDERSELASCLKGMNSADTLLVWKLDRPGRDLRHLEKRSTTSPSAASDSMSSPARARLSTPPQPQASSSLGSSPLWQSPNPR